MGCDTKGVGFNVQPGYNKYGLLERRSHADMKRQLFDLFICSLHLCLIKRNFCACAELTPRVNGLWMFLSYCVAFITLLDENKTN